MQIISKDVQELGAQEKLIRRPLEFFRYERKNRGDSLGGGATQCQNGRSMIEMLGVLAIIGVLSVGGIMGYSKAMMRYRINKTIEQITYIAGNVRTTFANQGNYEGIGDDNGIWKKAHIFPEDMWKEGENVPQSEWEEDVYLHYDKKNDADTLGNKAFRIIYVTVPQEACIELLSHDWSALNIKAITVGSDEDNELKLPASLEDVVRACSGWTEPDSDGLVDLNFHFDIDLSSSIYQSYGPVNGSGWRN